MEAISFFNSSSIAFLAFCKSSHSFASSPDRFQWRSSSAFSTSSKLVGYTKDEVGASPSAKLGSIPFFRILPVLMSLRVFLLMKGLNHLCGFDMSLIAGAWLENSCDDEVEGKA